MLRYVILLCFFVYSNNANTSKMPVPKFEAFNPSGIRVTLPDTPGVSEFFFWGNINVPMEGKDLGEIMLATYEPTNGVWLIEDMDVKIKSGDTIYYTFFVNINGVVHRYERQQYTVKEVVERPTTTAKPVGTTPKPTQTTTTSTTPKPTQPSTPKPTTPQTVPTTTQTIPTTTQAIPTTTPKQVQDMCSTDVIRINMSKDKTVITTQDITGKEIGTVSNKDCDKVLVIDFENGKIRFESAPK